MLVVGGTYEERCSEPHREMVYGSGMRGAAVLASTGSVRLITCCDNQQREVAELTAGAFNLDVEFRERAEPIRFSYYSPLTPPVIDGNNQPEIDISVEHSGSVLVYGMLEAEAGVSARGIVYDPQRPRGPSAVDRTQLASPRFAIVANISEVRRLGGSADTVEAARLLCKDTAADVVVVKRGPLGALVVEAGGQETPIGPVRTQTVWPIGSGDVFSAVFAWAWLEDSRTPPEAAHLASAATAAWCGSLNLSIGLTAGTQPEDIQYGVPLTAREEPVKVYLAGPFFDLGSRWIVNLARRALRQNGAVVFSPFHDVGKGGDEVAQKDLDGLHSSETVLGLLDGADAGTLFEFGYAASQCIPSVGYAENPDHEDYKMLRGLGSFITDDLSTAVYHAVWAGMEEA